MLLQLFALLRLVLLLLVELAPLRIELLLQLLQFAALCVILSGDALMLINLLAGLLDLLVLPGDFVFAGLVFLAGLFDVGVVFTARLVQLLLRLFEGLT